jgi:hypothetical protein
LTVAHLDLGRFSLLHTPTSANQLPPAQGDGVSFLRLTTMTSKRSSSSDLPAFLAVPLSSSAVFDTTCHHLTNREQRRLQISAKVLASSQGERLPTSQRVSAALGLDGGGDETRFAMNVGLREDNAKKNRCA